MSFDGGVTSHRAQAERFLAQPPRKWVLWAVEYHPNPASSSSSAGSPRSEGSEGLGWTISRRSLASGHRRAQLQPPSRFHPTGDTNRHGRSHPSFGDQSNDVPRTQPAPSPRRSSPIALPATLHPPSQAPQSHGYRTTPLVLAPFRLAEGLQTS